MRRSVFGHGSALLVGVALATACATSPPKVVTAPPSAPPPATRPAACFPVESLSPEDRLVAERLLLAIGDSEALYTLATGLKPISSGMTSSVRVAPDVDRTALETLEQRRRVAARLTCGDIGVFVQVFAASSTSDAGGTTRSFEVVTFHRASVAAAVSRHAEYFTALGITPSADPVQVVMAVEHAPRADRWRGYGYLFGFPDEAVDFFVRAGVEGDATQKVLPRDFRRIETWTKFGGKDGAPALSNFVYAVPKGAPETAADAQLRDAAGRIYRTYVDRRARFIKPDQTGAVALWRAWLEGPPAARQ
jgi:hypothetical protein